MRKARTEKINQAPNNIRHGIHDAIEHYGTCGQSGGARAPHDIARPSTHNEK